MPDDSVSDYFVTTHYFFLSYPYVLFIEIETNLGLV